MAEQARELLDVQRWQHVCMALKRTTISADSDDLAVIKEAAVRRGIPAAQIIREAIHRAALANGTWDEPFFSGVFEPIRRETLDILGDDETVADLRASREEYAAGDTFDVSQVRAELDQRHRRDSYRA